jgi:hypothetical protein
LKFHFPHWDGPVEKTEEGLRGGFEKMRTLDKESPQVLVGKSLEQGNCRRGFKPDAAVGSTNRSATTSACVGWDFDNIENRLAFRKQVAPGAVDSEPR